MVNEYKDFFFCFVFLLNIAQSTSGVRPEQEPRDLTT